MARALSGRERPMVRCRSLRRARRSPGRQAQGLSPSVDLATDLLHVDDADHVPPATRGVSDNPAIWAGVAVPLNTSRECKKAVPFIPDGQNGGIPPP
jgi:hypothetical protein